LARALDLHSRGQGFDSLILHKRSEKRSSLTSWEVRLQEKVIEDKEKKEKGSE
jgi:hypothetical protein